MGIKNLTEAEEKDFYRLVEKMNGKEPDKKQDAKVKKPQYGDTVYYINYIGRIRKRTWINDEDDLGMWKLGNIFFTEESAEFAREKRKVKVELQRYALEHNDPEKEAWDLKNRHFGLMLKHDTKDIEQTDLRIFQDESVTCFTSAPIARDAIEAVGKDRILKYIFNVDCEGMK